MTDRIPTAPITDLLEEIKNFEFALFPPTDEICPEHDKVLGPCPDELRRFYSFARYCERELKQLRLEREFASEKDPSIDSRMYQWDKKASLVRTMLWFALWEYFEAYQAGCGISLTKDWNVVVSEDQGPSFPGGLHSLLFGGPPRGL